VDDFYRAFEDKYRGSRETIKQRLRAYAGFITPLATHFQPATALDLGCGRGEWLELLHENGFAAHGVDLDDGMLAACRERGLQAENAEAVAALRALPDASLALVSAFHLVEHIPFDALQQLVREALRVLRPGGLLIMETPNPENLVVGASSFYMDPSHLKPIPPRLLSFLTEHAGFGRHKVIRLQEDQQLHTNAPIGLINVLEGVSPDYSVVAQKAGDPALLATLTPVFARDYGIDLAMLAQRFEAQDTERRAELHTALARLDARVSQEHAAGMQSLTGRLGVAEATHAALAERTEQIAAHLSGQIARQRADLDALRLAHSEAERARADDRRALAEAQRAALETQRATLEAQRATVEARMSEANAQVAQLKEEVAQARAERAQLAMQLAQCEDARAQALAHVEELQQRVASLLASRSWQITAPLRGISGLFPGSRQGAPWRLAVGVKRRLRAPLRRLVQTVLRRPRLKSAARRLLRHFPALQARAHTLVYTLHDHAALAVPPDHPAGLSPRATRIYRDLKNARDASPR
jgi:O-antigen chain-terminating methyltransferase